jgi:hypothetical protein
VASFRVAVLNHLSAAKQLDNGYVIIASELLSSAANLWSQANNMTKERFLEACGEVYEAAVKEVTAAKAKAGETEA